MEQRSRDPSGEHEWVPDSRRLLISRRVQRLKLPPSGDVPALVVTSPFGVGYPRSSGDDGGRMVGYVRGGGLDGAHERSIVEWEEGTEARRRRCGFEGSME